MPTKTDQVNQNGNQIEGKPSCFIIMPITDPEGYIKGHFKRVFDDIFVPACDKAGFSAILASDVQEANLIQLDVLKKIVDSPMALCDLSSRNPNVLFELGIRQAFDKPVVLVQEVGTPQIFDIAPLRYVPYRRERLYHEVLEDQEKIAEAIRATKKAYENNEGVNSIVRLLALSQPATIPNYTGSDKESALLQLFRAELDSLRKEIRRFRPSDNNLETAGNLQTKNPLYLPLNRMMSQSLHKAANKLQEMQATKVIVPETIEYISSARETLN